MCASSAIVVLSIETAGDSRCPAKIVASVQKHNDYIIMVIDPTMSNGAIIIAERLQEFTPFI